MLDSFDNSKRKCNQCKKYINIKHSVNSNKHVICIECGIKNMAEIFINLKQKDPNINLPPLFDMQQHFRKLNEE